MDGNSHSHTPAFFTAALIAAAPNFEAGKDDNEPRNDPMGVRTALTMTTSCNKTINEQHEYERMLSCE